MSRPPTRSSLPVVSLGPEALFRVSDFAHDGVVTKGSMQTGTWMLGPDGLPCAGSLGVLVDNALGLALIAKRPQGYWSVSAEISIELCAAIPIDGSLLRAEATLVQADAFGGLASARVLDEGGRVIALCSQRGRFIESDQGSMPAPAWDADGDPLPHSSTSGAASLVGAELLPTADGAKLNLTVTPRLVNPLGNLHGGISLCVSELVGLAALQQSGPQLETTSVHVVYARPVPLGCSVSFHASVTHRGRSLAVAQVISTNEGKPCTITTVTAHAKP
jgi:uncharacterized protein (TIGR00369 family)